LTGRSSVCGQVLPFPVTSPIPVVGRPRDWKIPECERSATRAEAVLHASAGKADWVDSIPVNDVPSLRRTPGLDWAQAVVPLRLSSEDVQYLVLGRRRGGSRYLSEDLKVLNRLAATVVEQVDRLRTSEVQRLVTQAELRALWSQINPHFLINVLNTLCGIIPKEARDARNIVTCPHIPHTRFYEFIS
jgi:hypothetical protein